MTFENFLLSMVLTGGLYYLLLAFTLKTHDFISGLMFKFLPFVFGSACVLYYLIATGLVK